MAFQGNAFQGNAFQIGVNSQGLGSNPFVQSDWPLPQRFWRPDGTWTWSYNLNLIGQDALVTGKQVYDLPPGAPAGPPRAIDLRTWVWNYNLNLIAQDSMIVGKQVYDLPSKGYEYATSLRTWIWNYNLNLIGKDAFPSGKIIYDLPPRAYPEPATRTWTWNYNLNLIGQDAFPPGEAITVLPPRAYEYPANLRTWIQTLNLAVNVPPPLPFNQYDWPLPKIPQQPTQIWTWSYNLNLIGKDRLPSGKAIYDLPSRGYVYPNDLRTWIQVRNLGLDIKSLPFNQYNWPNPVQPLYGVQLRTWINFSPPTAPRDNTLDGFGPGKLIRDSWDRDEWGRFQPGAGVRYMP